jgi:hypothetical protein
LILDQAEGRGTNVIVLRFLSPQTKQPQTNVLQTNKQTNVLQTNKQTNKRFTLQIIILPDDLYL